MNSIVAEERMRHALIFGVVVHDENFFAGNVADVVDATELASLGVNENIARENFLVVACNERRRFGFAEVSRNECFFQNVVVAHGDKQIRL